MLGTVVATAAMTAGQAYFLRRRIGGLQLMTTARATRRSSPPRPSSAASPTASGALLDDALGDSLLAQIVAVGGAIALGSAAYAALVLAMRIPEARQILELFTRRLRRS